MPCTLSNEERAFLVCIRPQLNHNRQFRVIGLSEAHVGALLSLEKRGLVIEGRDYMYTVTAEALNALLAAEQLDEQHAEEEHRREAQQQREDKLQRKDARRSWIQFWLTVISDILGILLGAYLAHATSWFDWLDNLIH